MLCTESGRGDMGNLEESRAKLLVMGDLTGACNSSHSGKGFISKGAGLAFLSGLRFLSTGGGSQSATGTGLLGGVFGLDLKPM